MGGYFVAGGALLTAFFGLLSALLFRGGLMLRLFGMAVATEAGEASRLRAFWRALIAWSPGALAGLGLADLVALVEERHGLLGERVGQRRGGIAVVVGGRELQHTKG